MKKTFLLLVAFAAQVNFAQNVFPTTGNVGIGTQNPLNNLDVNGNIQISNSLIPMGLMTEVVGGYTPLLNMSLNFREPNKNLQYIGAGFRIDSREGLPLFQWLKRELNTETEQVLMSINRSGNLGIGTNNALNALHVFKLNDFNGGSIRLGHSGSSDAILSFGWNNPTLSDAFKLSFNPHNSISNIVDLLTIGTNGNVGIGTANPTSKLTVAGNIASREVKVTVDAGADFVFEKDYDLLSLDSVDKFIKENKHLPEVASAASMQKDGINLSEMNIKLLQKIEELTLYMIEIKKENTEMKNKQLQFEKTISKLTNKT